jgi:hypothetical protein
MSLGAVLRDKVGLFIPLLSLGLGITIFGASIAREDPASQQPSPGTAPIPETGPAAGTAGATETGLSVLADPIPTLLIFLGSIPILAATLIAPEKAKRLGVNPFASMVPTAGTVGVTVLYTLGTALSFLYSLVA